MLRRRPISFVGLASLQNYLTVSMRSSDVVELVRHVSPKLELQDVAELLNIARLRVAYRINDLPLGKKSKHRHDRLHAVRAHSYHERFLRAYRKLQPQWSRWIRRPALYVRSICDDCVTFDRRYKCLRRQTH